MRYVIYYTWKDGTNDSFIVDNAKERDLHLKNLLLRNEFKSISYCCIYADGEYANRKYVFMEEL